MSVRDLLIVGAGPAGLATAIAARHAGVDALVIDQGTVADGIRRFPTHMTFFTTPPLLEIGGLPFTTPHDKPSRLEAWRYYRRAAELSQVAMVLRERVVAVEADRHDEAPVLVVTSVDAAGVSRARAGRAVALAMGYYDQPNLLSVPGEDLPHVSHYYTEAAPYYRQRVVVVGGKNSACDTALDLYRGGAQVTLVHRGAALGESVKYWVRPDIDNRIAEGSIAAHFESEVVSIGPREVQVRHRTTGAVTGVGAEAVFVMTGYQADHAFLERCGVRLHPETRVPEHDPATNETNVPGLYIAGGQLAGVRTGSVFIENGRLHGEVIARAVAARLSARG